MKISERILPGEYAGRRSRRDQLAGAAGVSLGSLGSAKLGKRPRWNRCSTWASGLVMVVSPFYADGIRSQLADHGLRKLAKISRIDGKTRGVVVWG